MSSARTSNGVTGHHRVAQLAVLINGFPFDSRVFSSDADVPLVRIRDLSACEFETFVPRAVVPSTAFVRDGDVVIGMDGDFNSVLWNRGEAALNQRVCLLRARSGVDPRYLAYAIPPHLREINELTWSTTVKHLAAGSVRAIRIPAWSYAQQRAVADYLDRETAQIDAFIAKNEELITLLTERRAAVAQSIVETHVGRGTRLKFTIREIDVRAGNSWEELPQLSVSISRGVTPRGDTAEASDDTVDLSHYKLARPGDVVLNRMRAFQGGVGVAPVAGLVSPDYAVLRPAGGLDSNWLALAMRTPRFVGEMTMRLRGIGSVDSGAVRTPRIGVADLGEILLETPSPQEQRSELERIEQSTSRIEAAVAVAQRSVDLARERRAALISAAVTGKIDVGVAA